MKDLDEPGPPATPSRPFPYRIAIRATLRDTDGVGHVNNAVYLSWTEEARMRYMVDRRKARAMADLDFILASAHLDYRSPVLLDEVVDLWYGICRVGTKSWEMAYEGRARGDGRLVVEARTVQVQFDYREGKTVPIPDSFRAILEEDLLR
jgi:acyl-CoA thioester hydrolase